VIASGAPPARAVRFDVGFAVLRGHFPAFGGVDAVYSPRRTVLDALLVDAARQAGAEVREGFTVEEIISVDGRVQGIRGRDSDGAPVTETVRQVLGADGKALATSAGRSRSSKPSAPTSRAISSAPSTWRATSASGCAQAGGPSASAAGPDLPNFFRKPYGPGWALVGDAGPVMDPITGQHRRRLPRRRAAGRRGRRRAGRQRDPGGRTGVLPAPARPGRDPHL
jgi:hypothetical protein